MHEHTEECAELFAAWRRYHWVAQDTSGRFTSDERLSAARERDMFRRLLDGAGCDPEALLALDNSEDADDE